MPDRPLPPEIKNAAYVIDTAMCRQYRSVIDLCSRGEAHDADILARSMFENLLALEFVSRPRISLSHYRKRYKSNAPKSMPPLLRARLYLTYYGFRWVVFQSRHKSTPGVKRHASRLASTTPKEVLAHYETLIGTEWVERFQKRPRTYSCLLVAELAESISRMHLRWYKVVYSFQSGPVHASEATRLLHVDGRDSDRWHDSPTSVECTIRTATDVFLAGVEALHDRIGFGSGVGMLLSGLDDEYKKLKSRTKKPEIVAR